jgi:hypothetical protein
VRRPGAQTVDEIVKRGEIVVGIDLTNPPWGFLDEKQEPAGFDPAYAKLLADKLGVKLKLERVTSPGTYPVPAERPRRRRSSRPCRSPPSAPSRSGSPRPMRPIR